MKVAQNNPVTTWCEHVRLKTPSLLFSILLLSALVVPSEAAQSPLGGSDTQLLERGTYLVKIAGCNDCHTPEYAETGGKTPEAEWLIGTKLGWRGPWGTTYPTNLRSFLVNISEDEWVQFAKNVQSRPPMPWFALRDMTESDLKAIHQLIKSLGPAGEPAPAYVPPDKTPNPPYVQFPTPSP